MGGDLGENDPGWAEIAYEEIAPAYDDFTAHHNYDLWLGASPKLDEVAHAKAVYITPFRAGLNPD